MVRRPDADRWAVVTLFREGLTPVEIVRRTGFDFRFVTRWIRQFKMTGTVNDKPRPGRKRKRTPAVEQEVVELMRGKRKRSCRVVARMLKDRGVATVQRDTVLRAAHAQHLRPYRLQRTSRLTEAHKRNRLAFAKAEKIKDWSRTIFTDEHVLSGRSSNITTPCTSHQTLIMTFFW